MCYNKNMKKISQEKLILLLKNKNCSYKELSLITGYHPKSLIRINKAIKENKYNIIKLDKEKLKEKIVNNYLNKNTINYKSYYNDKDFNFKISYTTLCKILNSANINEEIVLIQKIKKKGNYHFIIIDHKTKMLLFKIKSKKNDTKSTKKIIEILLQKYGTPKNISFINYFKKPNKDIMNLLKIYNISIIPYKHIYKVSTKNLLQNTQQIKYNNKNINSEYFYNCIDRTTIDINTIQFNNIRYKIKNNININKNTKVKLYFNDKKIVKYVKYNNKKYLLLPIKKLTSKKGNSKYL